MNFYLPSYDDCLNIVDSNPNLYFYESKFIIDSYNISIFGYRHASYNNFILPIIEYPNINALELKGVSFVFNDIGDVYRRCLMLHKFWELDQYDHCRFNKFENKIVKNVTEKLDGFLITFIMLPDGTIVSQTKKGFYNKDNIIANKYLEYSNYYRFIKNCLLNNIQPIFELIGDKLFVEYESENLVLLKMRCNLTGKYLDIKTITEVPVVEHFNYSIDKILQLKTELINKEGWIVHFDDDTLLKVKTDWWINEKNKKLCS